VRRPFGQLLTTIGRALTIFISGPLRVFEVIIGHIRQSRTLVSPIIDYDIESDAGGDRSIGLVGPAREFSQYLRLMSFAASEPPPPIGYGGHYREMADRLREPARFTRSPGIRRELIDLAGRYDRRGVTGSEVLRAVPTKCSGSLHTHSSPVGRYAGPRLRFDAHLSSQ
jgi:hypothetical protein